MATSLTLRMLVFAFILCQFLEQFILSVPNIASAATVKRISNNNRNNKFISTNSKLVFNHSADDDTFYDDTFPAQALPADDFEQQPIAHNETKSSLSSSTDSLGSFVVPETPAAKKYKTRSKTRVRRPRPTSASLVTSTPSLPKRRFGVDPIASTTTSSPITTSTSVSTISVTDTSVSVSTESTASISKTTVPATETSESSIVTTTPLPPTTTAFNEVTNVTYPETNLPENQSNHSLTEMLHSTDFKENNFNSTSTPLSNNRKVTFLGRLSFRLMDALEKTILSNGALFRLSQTALSNIKPVNETQFACFDPYCSLVPV